MDNGLLRRLVGVALACLVLLDLAEVIEAAIVSQGHGKSNFIEVKRAANLDLEKRLSHLLLKPKRNLDISNGARIHSGHPRVTDISKTEPGERVNIRRKRWDFKMDGCHCDGFKVECMHDSTCRYRHRSSSYECRHTCCGFQCIRDPSITQESTTVPHRNSTRYSSRYSTTTIAKSTRAPDTRSLHSSFKSALGSLHEAIKSALGGDHGNPESSSKSNSTISGYLGRIAQYVQGKFHFGQQHEHTPDDDDDGDDSKEVNSSADDDNVDSDEKLLH